MKNTKNLMFGLTLLLGIFLSLNIVSAATTINNPAASTTVGCGALTTFRVNSSDGSMPSRESVNLTFYAGSTLTANTSWTQIGTNNSLNLTLLLNGTVTVINLTNLLEDANNYIFNVTVKNNSEVIGEDTNTGMTIDCTVPTAPSSLTPATNSFITATTTQTFSSTVTNAQTTSCTYVINRYNSASDTASASGSATYSASTCSFDKTFSTSADNGDYSWTITASDETNTTISGSNVLSVNIGGSAGGLPYQTQTRDILVTPPTQPNNTILIVIGIIGLFVVLWLLIK